MSTRPSTSGSVNVNDLAVDSAGNIYATGSFEGAVELNPGNPAQTWTSAGAFNIFVVQLNSAGNFGWGEAFGGAGSDTDQGIAVDSSDNVDVVGYYENTVNFNPNPNGTPDDLTSNGGPNIYLLQLQQ